jgi:hypothetical protein
MWLDGPRGDGELLQCVRSEAGVIDGSFVCSDGT